MLWTSHRNKLVMHSMSDIETNDTIDIQEEVGT
jgi:hypothetical protein